MGAEDLVQSAGTTVVALMATDAWQTTRAGIVALWRRVRPVQADEIELALGETREELLAARRNGDEDSVHDLERDWWRRVTRLLAADPDAAHDLAALLAEARASLPPEARPDLPPVHLQARASGNAHIYQAGRDQHIGRRGRGD
ncbi:hypothetical protein [Streptomyces sp. NBC_00083]|uniref:hypothetical protein n=1 Tax=Streptomyces sp. NBC_00083 TaxID=2975647 RepID=UPI0022569F91|nr:hypothetical protein [Streptomyces sp. NBC_00083]MCX5388292.1 hypothetical protein [Streptomyces sp. NBC_00083]